MGACMKPPQLAIVTSLCKGMTLYRHLHLRKDKFNLNRISQIALQICHGKFTSYHHYYSVNWHHQKIRLVKME